MTRSANERAWLELIATARRAAVLELPNPAAEALGVMAGRLTTVSPGSLTMADQCLFNAFRWTCSAYARALPDRRREMGPALKRFADLVEGALTPSAPDGAAAMPVPPPAPLIDDDPRPEPQPRRDVFG